MENSNHHRMGVLSNYVVDRKLAAAAGFKDAPDSVRQKMADLSSAALNVHCG